ncbi:hypothetical protein Scep_030126 [Stephania cephalantha]|uniref:Uncharacterized protein n=1 Tax=Stephania cephalantha TaxID=152367 RepID=A0AAP0HI95_9MAGN
MRGGGDRARQAEGRASGGAHGGDGGGSGMQQQKQAWRSADGQRPAEAAAAVWRLAAARGQRIGRGCGVLSSSALGISSSAPARDAARAQQRARRAQQCWQRMQLRRGEWQRDGALSDRSILDEGGEEGGRTSGFRARRRWRCAERRPAAMRGGGDRARQAAAGRSGGGRAWWDGGTAVSARQHKDGSADGSVPAIAAVAARLRLADSGSAARMRSAPSSRTLGIQESATRSERTGGGAQQRSARRRKAALRNAAAATR